MLFPFAPVKSRTSGPKGHKDDNVHAGDKSPAYHLTAKCLIQVCDKILRAFQAHGEPQQRLR